MSTATALPGSPFGQPTTERTLGSSCLTCNGTGFVLPPFTGDISVAKLAKLPCPSPKCTVNRKKECLGRDQLNILVRKNIVVENVKAVVSVMPMLSKDYEFSETVTLTNVKAPQLTDDVFEAAHQRIGDYQSMVIVMIDIDGNHYEFTSKDSPLSGRLTTERKPKEPIMTPAEARDIDRAFDPSTPEAEAKAIFKKMAETPLDLSLTGSPDLVTSRTVQNTAPLPETVKAAPVTDKIIGDQVEMELLELLRAKFPDDSQQQFTNRWRTVIKANDFGELMKRYPTRNEAIEAARSIVKGYIDLHAPNKPTEPPPSAPVAQPTPTPTITTIIQATPTETPAPQLALVPRQHSEAPVTCYPDRRGDVVYQGVHYNLSIREGGTAEQAIGLLKEWSRFWEMAAEMGVTTSANAPLPVMQPPVNQAAAPVASAPAPTQSPAPDGGEVTCVMITVGMTYTNPKPQLEFTIDGMEYSLKYARPIADMVKLLSGVTKNDGTPFTAADLTNGRKFIGNWKIAYRPTEKDGKTYRNVIGVSRAA